KVGDLVGLQLLVASLAVDFVSLEPGDRLRGFFHRDLGLRVVREIVDRERGQFILDRSGGGRLRRRGGFLPALVVALQRGQGQRRCEHEKYGPSVLHAFPLLTRSAGGSFSETRASGSFRAGRA